MTINYWCNFGCTRAECNRHINLFYFVLKIWNRETLNRVLSLPKHLLKFNTIMSCPQFIFYFRNYFSKKKQTIKNEISVLIKTLLKWIKLQNIQRAQTSILKQLNLWKFVTLLEMICVFLAFVKYFWKNLKLNCFKVSIK